MIERFISFSPMAYPPCRLDFATNPRGASQDCFTTADDSMLDDEKRSRRYITYITADGMIEKSIDIFREGERLCEETIETYKDVFEQFTEKKERGKNPNYPFPVVMVRYDGTKYILITGHHRFHAAHRAGLTEILVQEFMGTEDEAVWLAIRDNRKHGLRLNRHDIKYCVVKALKRFPDKTAGAIARELGCSRSHANEVRLQLSACGQLPAAKKRIGANGKTYPVKPKAKTLPATALKKSDGDSTTEQPSGKSSEKTSKQVSALSVENETETNPSQEENEEQLSILERAIGNVLPALDEIVEGLQSHKARTRFIDVVSEWASNKRDNLSPPHF